MVMFLCGLKGKTVWNSIRLSHKNIKYIAILSISINRRKGEFNWINNQGRLNKKFGLNT